MKKTFLRKTEIPEAIKETIDTLDYANIFKKFCMANTTTGKVERQMTN